MDPLALITHHNENGDDVLPYINDKTMEDIMKELPSSVFEGLKTASFRRLVNLVMRLFHQFWATEKELHPSTKKDMYVYGGYIRRRIVTNTNATDAITTFERDNGPLSNHFRRDENNKIGLWCTRNMFMDPKMDIDFHFECSKQSDRFIEYLRGTFKVNVVLTPDNDYPKNQKPRSFHITSRLLDPMGTQLKIDINTPTEDLFMFPDFSANQLRQTPSGNVYMVESKYFHYNRGFLPPSIIQSEVPHKDEALVRTVAGIENGATRMLLVPIRWFRTETALGYVRELLHDKCIGHTDEESIAKAYKLYLRHVFSRLPKTIGFTVVNFESSVQYRDGDHYVVHCCSLDQTIHSGNVREHEGNIMVKCGQCFQKIIIFTDFLAMKYDW